MNPTIEETIKKQMTNRKNAHFMLVDGMSKLLTHGVVWLQSSFFNVSGLNWKLTVKPVKINGTEALDHLCLYLWLTDAKSLPSNSEVKCSYKVSVVSQTQHVADSSRGYVGRYTEKTTRNTGTMNFISWALMEMYIVNDKAVFCAEITSVEVNFPTTSIPRTIGTANRLKLTEVPRGNSRFTWKITQFSSFDGHEHSSYEFTVGPRRWKLEMYPKGKEEGKGNFLSLYLNASDYVTNGPKEDTFPVFKLRVLDQLHGKHHEMIRRSFWFTYNESGGYPKFLPLEELHDPRRGFLVNDQIYIGVEFLLVSTTEYL